MTTRNTLEDLKFAEMYVEFIARSHSDPVVRARGQLMLALIALLDQRRPMWRADLLNRLGSANVARTIEELLPLPTSADDELFVTFLDKLLKKGEPE